MTTKTIIHDKAVTHAACDLIENEISTISGTKRGIDLITASGKTILVRGKSKDGDIPLMNGTLDTLKANYLVIVTNMVNNHSRKVCIMTMSEAKRLSVNQPYKNSGRDNYFIKPGDYTYYQNDHRILK